MIHALQPRSPTAPSRVGRLHLGALVERCVGKVAAWHAASGLRIEVDVDPDLPLHRLGDEALVSLVLLQQLEAVARAAAAGPVRLTVGPSARAGADVRLDVSAGGRTQPPAALVRALSASGDGPAHPQDLAPALLGALVESMGGRLSASAAGDCQGLCADLALAPDPQALADARGAASTPLQVLLVEDHPVNAEMTTDMLERGGDIRVVLAATGEEALKTVLRQRFDVVLMDMFLPDTDGVVVARRMTRLLGAGAPPMIALTANAYASDRELCRQAGMVDFLAKPIGVQALVETVRRWGRWFRDHEERRPSDFPDGDGGGG